jgi:hypothetical protein
VTTWLGGPAREEPARSALAAALALVFVLVASAAWGRPLTDQEKAALAATVESYEAALREGNYARVMQAMPPKVIAAIARRAGASPNQVVAELIREVQEALQRGDVKIESFRFDLGRADHKEHSTGAPYAVIPTEAIVAVRGGRRVREKSLALALLEEGQWSLLRMSDARQLQILREAYPEFAGVEFPRSSTEIVNP